MPSNSVQRVIGSAATAVYIGLWAGGVAAVSDPVIALILLTLAFGVALAAISTHDLYSRKQKLAFCLVSFIITMMGGLIVWLRHEPEAAPKNEITRIIDRRFYPFQVGEGANNSQSRYFVDKHLEDPALGFKGPLTPQACTYKVARMTDAQVQSCVADLIERLKVYQRGEAEAEQQVFDAIQARDEASWKRHTDALQSFYQSRNKSFDDNFRQECKSLDVNMRSRLGIASIPIQGEDRIPALMQRDDYGRFILKDRNLAGPDPIGAVIDYLTGLSIHLS